VIKQFGDPESPVRTPFAATRQKPDLRDCGLHQVSSALNANSDLLSRRAAAIPKGLSTFAPVFAARAENAEIWDVEGRRYVDFAGGIAVLNVGHRHPKVMAAVQAQLECFTHTAFQVMALYRPCRAPERACAFLGTGQVGFFHHRRRSGGECR